MNTECERCAAELASTIDGDAWYGDSLRKILDGVTAEQARAHPIPNGHSIWEMVVHLDVWIGFFSGATQGVAIPPWPTMARELDWPSVTAGHERAWRESVSSLFEHHAEFVEMIRSFGDDRLESTVPGRAYDFYQLFHSASLHAAYHGGQIALLKKMVT